LAPDRPEPGLGLSGLGLWGSVPIGAGVHAIGVGAMGSLTLTVMARTRLLYRYRDANAIPVVHAATLMVTVAAVLRSAAVWAGGSTYVAMVAASAALWAVAFAIGAVVLARTLVLRGAARGEAHVGV
jgi:uncharacterized protein involved in response to NO